ncbi:MAG: HDOD domain-containing protein [Azonexus sp.]|uniref:EAL and HDOD domain-containing protein n=1 Tax=Azonexus sp. TaxID=1872668 RepID=UPI00283A4859|nr:HDOD domain-containing protein [Azonexus sp.]MDR0776451.1 HDOD domain-containing protein [Azonexus sp.]
MFEHLKKLFSVPPQATPARRATTPATTVAEEGGAVFLRRDAVFDRQGQLAGHLFRTGDTLSATVRQADSALLSTLNASPDAWNAGLAFVPLSSASLDLAAVDELRSTNLVLLLDLAPSARGAQNEELGARIEALRQRGIAIALFRQPKHPSFSEIIHLADYGAIDVAATEPSLIRDFSAAFRTGRRDHPAGLFAAGIETIDEYRLCHLWHFDYFHGSFAAQTLQHADETATDPHKMQLLHVLRLVQSDAETAEIAAALRQDPPLAFRILRYLNSPLIGLDHRIESLSQALTILGRQRLMRWLAVLLFSVREPAVGDWLLIESALTRGRLMELLGDRVRPGQPADALFLTGIFSCLEQLLRRPLAELLDEIPLAEDVRAALLHGEGTYAPLLALVEAAEAFDHARIAYCADALAVPADAVNRALLAATAWASEVSEHWD